MAGKKPVEVIEESEDVKKLLAVIASLGDTVSVSARVKFEGLLERARANDAASKSK